MKKTLFFVLFFVSSSICAQNTSELKGIAIPELGWYDGFTGIIYVDFKDYKGQNIKPSKAYEYNLNNCQEMIKYINILKNTLIRYDSISNTNNVVDYEKELNWNFRLCPKRNRYDYNNKDVKYIRKNNVSYILLPLTYEYYERGHFTQSGHWIDSGNRIGSIGIRLSLSGNVYDYSFYPHMSFDSFLQLVSCENIQKYIDTFNQQKEQKQNIDNLFD